MTSLPGTSLPQTSLARTSLVRTEVVRPGMCGHNSLFIGEIGDWTWDAVSEVCGTDVLRARDASGAPAYLSFYYYRVRGGRRFHLRTPAFGDRLRISTALYSCGSESVLTLHRISRSGTGEHGPIDLTEFYAGADSDCLYVENLNRWVARTAEDSNRELARAAPPDFDHRHLPQIPAAYSPRPACHRARSALTFLPEAARPAGEELRVDYAVDPSRDLNGAGLLYFASYFSIVDRVLLQWWREQRRTDAGFLARVVTDQQLCYLGNADAGTVITGVVRPWRVGGEPGHEFVNVVLRDRERVLAVCTLTLLREETS
ncbi:LnmK family bifunctional acyltransferase/decarboxylase [Sphaerimonospora sp. CA-214678]|uniref:LnmK family bifunctional acyltransferase/decarboxylase n=1 Tax=Sphaerimonospora sp. CA-214678 TaxID=3240029 RepID=UPI003D92FFD7